MTSAERVHKQRKVRFNSQFHKTTLCTYWGKYQCSHGIGCKYAHGVEELRDMPDLTKTSMCVRFRDTGSCDDPTCTFAHRWRDLRATHSFEKVTMCRFFPTGDCYAGENCRHAHSQSELQFSPDQVQSQRMAAQRRLQANKPPQCLGDSLPVGPLFQPSQRFPDEQTQAQVQAEAETQACAQVENFPDIRSDGQHVEPSLQSLPLPWALMGRTFLRDHVSDSHAPSGQQLWLSAATSFPQTQSDPSVDLPDYRSGLLRNLSVPTSTTIGAGCPSDLSSEHFYRNSGPNDPDSPRNNHSYMGVHLEARQPYLFTITSLGRSSHDAFPEARVPDCIPQFSSSPSFRQRHGISQFSFTTSFERLASPKPSDAARGSIRDLSAAESVPRDHQASSVNRPFHALGRSSTRNQGSPTRAWRDAHLCMLPDVARAELAEEIAKLEDAKIAQFLDLRKIHDLSRRYRQDREELGD